MNRRELPPGWTEAELGQHCQIVRGITFPASAKVVHKTEKYVCCLRTTNVQEAVDWNDIYFVPREFVKRDDQFVRPGDILMSMANSYELVGKVAIATEVPMPSAFGAFLSVIRPLPGTDGKFLYYLLKTPFVQSELRNGSSQTVNIANISVKRASAISVPIAPRNEQRGIAEKLDSVLSRVRACHEHLERVSQFLKRFREAVLEAAVSGRLTEEWRTGTKVQFPSQPDWVELATLCLVGRVITYGVIKLGEPVDGGVPCLRTSNVRWLHFEIEGMKCIDPELSAQYSRTVLQGTEVLVNVRGTLGGVGAVTSAMRGWNVSREVAVVPVDDTRINQKFLALWIAAKRSQRWLQRVQKGVAYTGINIEDLRALPVAVPSRSEQAEIVRRVEQLFALAERIEQKHRTASLRIEALSPAILRKAFRGELMTQQASEEPLEMMLTVSARPRTKRAKLPVANRRQNPEKQGRSAVRKRA